MNGRPGIAQGSSLFHHGRPTMLDLFCGAGGASRGYHDAGFEVVGVDIKPQPRYPYKFIQADAIRYLTRRIDFGELGGLAAIHASPPCQAYTRAGALRTEGRSHPDLIAPVRDLLVQTHIPWVIENVPGSPLESPVQLCGTAFGLGWTDWDLQRHRLFESNIDLCGTGCFHSKPAISVVGHGATKATRERLGRNPSINEKRVAMGIDWMNRDELSEAIPPVYTRDIGRQLMFHLIQHALPKVAA